MSKISPRLIIFLVVFVDLVGFGIMIPMLPFYARSFGANAMDVGWLMFVYSFSQIFVSPFWGQMSDRYGRRPILLVTILGQALAMGLGAFAGSYIALLLSRILAGIFAANISTASAFMADVTKPEDRAKGMGMIGAAFGLGFILGPAIGGVLVEYEYSWPMLFAAGLGLLNFILAFGILPEPFKTSEERSSARRKVSLVHYKSMFSEPKLLMPVLLFFLLTLAFTQVEITFGLFVADRFSFSPRQAGFLLAGMGLVMAFVQGGGIGRLVKKFGEKNLIGFGMPLIVFGLLGLSLALNLWIFCAGLFFLAVGYSLINPCLSSLMSKAAPVDQQGTFLGVYQSGGSLARVVGPPLAGGLYDWRISGAFLGSMVVVLIAKIIFSWASRSEMMSSS